jgi:UDP-galactopyranose mutase
MPDHRACSATFAGIFSATVRPIPYTMKQWGREPRELDASVCGRVAYEYPEAHGDRYYPVPAPDNLRRYARYRALAGEVTRTADHGM